MNLPEVEVTVNGKPLKHQVYHSPTGFEWGYGGSGPADLARSILWDHLGKEPSPALYQEFKRAFVACWVDEWQISSREIQDWIDTRDYNCIRLPYLKKKNMTALTNVIRMI